MCALPPSKSWPFFNLIKINFHCEVEAYACYVSFTFWRKDNRNFPYIVLRFIEWHSILYFLNNFGISHLLPPSPPFPQFQLKCCRKFHLSLSLSLSLFIFISPSLSISLLNGLLTWIALEYWKTFFFLLPWFI